MTAFETAALVWAGVALGLHLLATALSSVRVRARLPQEAAGPHNEGLPGVAVLVPVKGLDAEGEATLASLLRFDYPHYSAIFALDDPEDPAIPAIRAAMVRPGEPDRILTGANLLSSNNPKIDTLSKAYAAADAPLILHCDANVLMEPARLADSVRRLGPGVGMVTATFVGVRAASRAARLEAAILNGYHARLILAGHVLGVPSAIGKLMLYRRADLEAVGGFPRLAENPADDTALENLIVGQGLKVRMAPKPLHQPLGVRRFGEVWRRQVRWLVMRRINHPIAYVGEIAVSALPGVAAAAVAAPGLGIPGWISALAFMGIWYAAEACFLLRARLQVEPFAPFYWVVRDLLLLPMWGSSLAARSVEWRGSRLKP